MKLKDIVFVMLPVVCLFCFSILAEKKDVEARILFLTMKRSGSLEEARPPVLNPVNRRNDIVGITVPPYYYFENNSVKVNLLTENLLMIDLKGKTMPRFRIVPHDRCDILKQGNLARGYLYLVSERETLPAEIRVLHELNFSLFVPSDSKLSPDEKLKVGIVEGIKLEDSFLVEVEKQFPEFQLQSFYGVDAYGRMFDSLTLGKVNALLLSDSHVNWLNQNSQSGFPELSKISNKLSMQMRFVYESS